MPQGYPLAPLIQSPQPFRAGPVPEIQAPGISLGGLLSGMAVGQELQARQRAMDQQRAIEDVAKQFQGPDHFPDLVTAVTRIDPSAGMALWNKYVTGVKDQTVAMQNRAAAQAAQLKQLGGLAQGVHDDASYQRFKAVSSQMYGPDLVQMLAPENTYDPQAFEGIQTMLTTQEERTKRMDNAARDLADLITAHGKSLDSMRKASMEFLPHAANLLSTVGDDPTHYAPVYRAVAAQAQALGIPNAMTGIPTPDEYTSPDQAPAIAHTLYTLATTPVQRDTAAAQRVNAQTNATNAQANVMNAQTNRDRFQASLEGALVSDAVKGLPAPLQAAAGQIQSLPGMSGLQSRAFVRNLNQAVDAAAATGMDPSLAAADVIGTTWINREPATSKRMFEARANLRQALGHLRELFRGVPTNLIRGTIEDTVEALGHTNDPRMAQIAEAATMAYQQYKLGITGLQSNSNEDKQIRSVMPSYREEPPLREAKMGEMLKVLGDQDESSLSVGVGPDVARLWRQYNDSRLGGSRAVGHGAAGSGPASGPVSSYAALGALSADEQQLRDLGEAHGRTEAQIASDIARLRAAQGGR